MRKITMFVFAGLIGSPVIASQKDCIQKAEAERKSAFAAREADFDKAKKRFETPTKRKAASEARVSEAGKPYEEFITKPLLSCKKLADRKKEADCARIIMTNGKSYVDTYNREHKLMQEQQRIWSEENKIYSAASEKYWKAGPEINKQFDAKVKTCK